MPQWESQCTSYRAKLGYLLISTSDVEIQIPKGMNLILNGKATAKVKKHQKCVNVEWNTVPCMSFVKTGWYGVPTAQGLRYLCTALSEMPFKSYRHPHGHFPWGCWDDSLLKVLASHCHNPVPAEQSKESTRYFSHSCDFSRKMEARSYITESCRFYVPCWSQYFV